MKKHNFSAGPAILPKTVLTEAAAAVLDYEGIGLSLLEVSHRGPEVVAILDEAPKLAKELLNLDDAYEVLFLTGGASSQFFMVPMNLLNENETACYIDTGTWASKAIKEALLFGNVKIIASSKSENYTHIPKEYTIPSDAKYVHITTNNTIYGTQFMDLPKTTGRTRLVADMSSDIFSRAIDYRQFDLIYAGAQKNMGPAGTTMVIVKKDILGTVGRAIPTMLDYRTHIKKQSAFNTPPIYPIYVCLLTMRWLKAMGGVSAVEAQNRKKAQTLYDEIDANPLFEGIAAKENRSLMNVTFQLKDGAFEASFLEICANAGISGVKGHRSVGGFRASIYNALSLESIEALVNVMRNFAQKHS